MRAAIAIDPWKLEIFERHLSQAGYAYEKGPGLTQESLHLYVTTENMQALELVVRAANLEAARTPMTKAEPWIPWNPINRPTDAEIRARWEQLQKAPK